jgi:hypothetical protein
MKLSLTLSALLLSGSIQVNAAHPEIYTAFISAAQEVPGCTSPALGYGIATVEDHEFCIKLSYDGLSGPELFSHVHGPAAVGETGPVVFTLDTSTEKKQCFMITEDFKMNLDNKLYYFNIHSEMCPGGEIRAQILPAPAPPTGPTSVINKALGIQNEPVQVRSDTYFSLISAAQEVPGCMSSALGNAIATVEGDQFCIKLNYDGLSGPELFSHVHGPATFGETGPVIFTLDTSTQKTQCFTLTGDNKMNLDNELYYFNVHSDMCPGGEIRGQILPTPAPSTGAASIIIQALKEERPTDTYYAVIGAAQEVPGCMSSATGNAIATVEGNQFCIKLSYDGLSGPELFSHVHGPAAVGETGPVVFTLNTSTQKTQCFELTEDNKMFLEKELYYFNVHSEMCQGGEIRGQIVAL